MPGPAPKPAAERRRRNAPLANTVRLPAAGRQGDAPLWPLGTIEPDFWDELWRLPQAVQWEKNGWHRVIARYAMLVSETEKVGCSAVVFGEVRQMEDRLGLSPMALLKLRWEIEAPVEGADVSAPPPTSPGLKRRLKVV